MKYSLKNRPRFLIGCRGAKKRIALDKLDKVEEWFEGLKQEVKEDIIRLLQLRAGSIYPVSFEAGVVYGYLRILGKQPALIERDDVDDFINLICSFRTKEDAEKKLKEILGGNDECRFRVVG